MIGQPQCNSVTEIICEGSPHEMGRAQGVAAKRKIHDANQAIDALEAFQLQQPPWLPYRAYRFLAEQRAARFLAEPLGRDHPAMMERLAGISEGAEVAPNRILFFNAFEQLLSSVGGCTACPGACSAVAVRGRRAAGGAPILARNFDYLPLAQPFYLVRECKPRDGLRTLEFTSAPLLGAIDGMNEAGLCITYNYGFTTDQPSEPAAPISIVISAALQRCRNVAEAADYLASSPRWGGALLMLVDADGDIASLELSSTRSFLRHPVAGEHLLHHSNAFSSTHMQDVQIAWDAVYTDSAPSALRGRRLHASAEGRDQRFRELLGGETPLDCDALTAVMADHGPEGIPSDHTPCVHSSYWNTTACIQFLPKTRRMRVSFSSACQARFEEIGF